MSVAELYVRWQDIERANRAEIREVADLYFARFEATLEKGLAELRGDMALSGRAGIAKWPPNDLTSIPNWPAREPTSVRR